MIGRFRSFEMFDIQFPDRLTRPEANLIPYLYAATTTTGQRVIRAQHDSIA